MVELNFLVFCITVIVLTAIVFGKDDVATKALSTLTEISKSFTSVFSKIYKK